MEQLVARQVLQPLAGEASSFSFAGSTLANSGMFRRTARSLVKVMVDLLLVYRTLPSPSL